MASRGELKETDVLVRVRIYGARTVKAAGHEPMETSTISQLPDRLCLS